MRKILGKLWRVSYFLLLFLCCSLFYSGQSLFGASIVLRIMDINSRAALKTVAVGQPFVVEMRLQGFDESKKAPTIPGLAVLRVQQKQEQLTVVNGNVTNVYQYVCCVDATGFYGLGPVTVDHNSKQVTSNILTFLAKEQSEPAKPGGGKQRNKKEQPVICRLTLAHDNAVVGQKITCTLRLYYSDAVTALAGVRRPDLSGFVLGEFARGQEGQEQVDGIEYRYVDFVGDICAQEPGKKMIPAFSVDYDVQLPGRGSFFDFFNHAKRERVYSNTVHLMVEALPDTDKKIHAIGAFQALDVSLDMTQAKEGEGITLRAEVVGCGNVAGNFGDLDASRESASGQSAGNRVSNVNTMGMAQFELQGLSDSIKQYASKQYTVPASNSDPSLDQSEKTCFEFVVQGLSVGKQEIPAQEFTYFDVVKKKYVTLRSKPVLFTVTAPEGAGRAAGNSQVGQDSAASESDYSQNGVSENSVRDNRVSENGVSQNGVESAHARALAPNQIPLSKATWYPVKQRGAMPWGLFIFMLLVPVGVLLIFYMWRRLESYQGHYIRLTHTKRALEQARSELAQSKNNGDAQALHALFVRLFARRSRVSETVISRDFIKKLLEQRHYLSQEIVEFDLFMSELEACKYSQNTQQNSAILLEKAGQYILWLEKRL